jgi:hypothetical protein
MASLISDLDLMASAGHELQHALEVLANASLRSTAAIQFFYMRGLSRETLHTPETAAAEATGNGYRNPILAIARRLSAV